MEILIDDIREGGLLVSATEGDPWLFDVLCETEEGAFGKGNTADAAFKLVRYGGNVTIDGILTFETTRRCDRCLSDFKDKKASHIHAVLIPGSSVEEKHMDKDEVELKAEDLEFGYYDGDRIDLSDVIKEHIVLVRPMKYLCSEGCKGLCQKCGKNLNDGICGCVGEHAGPRWDALKDVKFPPKAAKVKKTKAPGKKKAAAKGRKKASR